MIMKWSIDPYWTKVRFRFARICNNLQNCVSNIFGSVKAAKPINLIRRTMPFLRLYFVQASAKQDVQHSNSFNILPVVFSIMRFVLVPSCFLSNPAHSLCFLTYKILFLWKRNSLLELKKVQNTPLSLIQVTFFSWKISTRCTFEWS